jgi:hypothetical protein
MRRIRGKLAWAIPLVLGPQLMSAGSALAETCVKEAGSATGITRGFAEYESFLIIRQVTGNWPFQADRISQPTYTCKGEGMMWTCRAVAQVCKG